MTPKLSPPQLELLYIPFSNCHSFRIIRRKVLHEESAANTSVRSEAGDIVVEAVGNVEADVVGDREQETCTAEVSISAEENVAVGVLKCKSRN